MIEEWKPIAEFPGYSVSDCGRIRSPKRGILKGRIVIRNGKPSYITVFICGCTRAVHALVLESFVGPRPDRMEGCHNDGNGLNNVPSNLRWDTHKNNMADAILLGTFIRPSGFKRGNTLGRGAQNIHAKLQECDAQNIRQLSNDGVSVIALAKFYGLHSTHIRRIKNGQAWPGLPLLRRAIADSTDKELTVIA